MMQGGAGPGHPCPECGGLIRAGARFCSGCGHGVGATAVVPAGARRPLPEGRFVANWNDLKRTVWLFGLLLLSSLVFGFVFRVNTSPWTDAVFSAVDAAIVLVFVGGRHRELLPFLTVPHPSPRTALGLGGVSLLFLGVMTGYFSLLERMGVPVAHLSETYVSEGWPVWSMFLLVCAMPAVFEELAFRGVIQSTLERVLGRREAWLIQAALFSVLHLTPLVFPSHFVMGLCFGYLRTRSRSLYPGMLLHAAWNALVLFKELHSS